MSTDRIEKQLFLRAPLSRVWRALSDSGEFGTWFGMTVDAPFTPGARLNAVITATKVDPEVARMQEAYKGKSFEITVERMVPERLFSFRWHPHAVEPGVDYSQEPTTLVEFTLEETPGGVMLTVSESGFDRIPLARRAQAFSANEQGWGLVIHLIEKFLAHAD
ncbi:MAG TPA: SRPBCC family protein [Candidatus Acidoferrales bacterium]|nr:SRPBCC family protein [Candidatus Acidoferrales bacterium]